MRAVQRFLFCLLAIWTAPLLAQVELLGHRMTIELDPAGHRLQVRDQISLPESFPRVATFLLHRGLKPSAPQPDVRIQPLPGGEDTVWMKYRLERSADSKRVIIDYAGELHHPLQAYGQEQARGFRSTPGLISEEGAYLSGGSFWYPQFGVEHKHE